MSTLPADVQSELKNMLNELAQAQSVNDRNAQADAVLRITSLLNRSQVG